VLLSSMATRHRRSIQPGLAKTLPPRRPAAGAEGTSILFGRTPAFNAEGPTAARAENPPGAQNALLNGSATACRLATERSWQKPATRGCEAAAILSVLADGGALRPSVLPPPTVAAPRGDPEGLRQISVPRTMKMSAA